MANPKIRFIWDSAISGVLGDEKNGVTGARLRNLKTNAESVLETDGIFIAIGHFPNTELFKGQIELDEQGYILTDRKQRTNIPGVFAGGDVQDHVFRQAITAAGTGCAAAMEAEKYLAGLEHQEG